MKSFVFLLGMLWCCHGFCQPDSAENVLQFPVFKAVSHPFMPTITSDYFYFSKDGLMWFSTAQGLCSFDGSEVVQYSTQEQAYMFGLNRIRAIAEDKDYNLYLGGDNRLSYFNRKNKTFTPLSYQLEDTSISFDISTRSIYIAQGRVYIGTDARGLLIYDPGSKIFQHLNLNTARSDCWDEENLNTICSFASHATDSSKLWLGTFNGIYLFNTVTKQFARNFQVMNPAVNKFLKCPQLYDVRKMDVADDSTIWFSTSSNGFAKYNSSSGQVKLFMHDKRLKTKDIWKAYHLREFARWGPGKYIVGVSEPNPGIFDTKREELQLFKVYQRPYVHDDIQYVANDRKGNVWILNKGLFYVSFPDYYRLQTVSIKKQLTQDYLPNQFGDIYFDKETSQYYAAVPFSSGVYVLDSNLQVIKIIPAPLYTNRYTYRETSNEFITKDGSGRFWTTGLETYILQPGENKFDYAEKIFPALQWMKSKGEAVDITATVQGNILIRYLDGTVFHIDHRTLIADTISIADYKSEPENMIGTINICYDSLRNKIYLNNLKYVVQYDINTHKSIPLSYDILFGTVNRRRPIIDYALDVQGRLFNTINRVQLTEYALDSRGRIWVWIPRYGIRVIDPDKLVCIDSIPNGARGFIPGNFNFIRSGGKDCMFFIGLRGAVVYNYKIQQSLLFDVSNGWSGQFDYGKEYCNNHLFIGGENQIEYFDLANFSKFNLKLEPLLNTITAGPHVVFTRTASNEKIEIELPHDQNSLTFSFSAPEFFFPERIEYAYQLTNAENIWQYSNSFNHKITYNQLTPGKYTFRLKAQILGGNWQDDPAEYTIIINPAFWQTWWFKLLIIILFLLAVAYVAKQRINVIRKNAFQKSKIEKEILELEAKALRSQMNPHFIFNCMNSIKALIQQEEKDKAVTYLTIFSKLLRTIFQNSDEREITLFDEIETCRLYTQLESLRFGNKLACFFIVDEKIDLKSIKVPALILQPFIENAIWHGIMPKDGTGTVTVTIDKKDNIVTCVIDDDGIGREMSKQSKFKSESPNHQSKGVSLTQNRLNLDNLLNQRNATVAIIDKESQGKKACGTMVVINLEEY